MQVFTIVSKRSTTSEYLNFNLEERSAAEVFPTTVGDGAKHTCEAA
jgi:hypothetical protein